MAHMWVREDDGRWGVLPLGEPGLALGVRSNGNLAWEPFASETENPDPHSMGGVLAGPVHLLPSPSGPASWLLLAPQTASVWVNGTRLRWGLHVLADRDEVRLGSGRPAYFSLETLARVEPLPSSDRTIYCARCRLEIEVGSPAVQCPAPDCCLWHHESDASGCWSYAPSCALCAQSTNFEAGFRWQPAGL